MTIKERKEREKEDKRNFILDTAESIIETEGIDKLSIRKIAERMEYSPAIIYHYFRDKEDILNHLMQKGYQQIVQVLSSAQQTDGEPAQRIREMFYKYIDLAMQMPDTYKSIMLSSSPGILEHTSVLFKGSREKRPAVGILCQCLKELHRDVDDSTIELTAQVIWASTFGLITRLLIERSEDEEHKNQLIEHFLQMMMAWVKQEHPGKTAENDL